MDAKITKKRLGRMLSYDWLKIVLCAAALIFGWVLVFTTTATRIKSSQNFTVANFMGNYSASVGLTNSVIDARENGGLSYEVIETSVCDLSMEESTALQLLQARTSTDELDLMFISTQPYASASYTKKNEAGEDVTLYRSYLESFIGGYRYNLHSLDGENGFFVQMANYLNSYYGGDYASENAVLDAARVESEFRARAKKSKDKRYKKEKQIKKGVQGEIERFEKYRQSLISFNEYLEKGWVTITNTAYMDYSTKPEGEDLFEGKGCYSINICPETTTDKIKTNLARIVGYYVYDEQGTRVSSTAKDMQVCLFNSNGKGEEFRYEGLNYICYLIDSLNK